MLKSHVRRVLMVALPLALAVGVVFWGAPDAVAGAAVAKASFVKGSVEVGPTAEGPFKRLKRNRKVKAGSFVKTGADSRAELKFSDGSVTRIGAKSLLAISDASFNAKSREVKVKSRLVAGKAWSKVSKLVGGDARFEMETENAVAGVRGTVFRVNIDNDAATVVRVYNGSVAVSNGPYYAAQRPAAVEVKGPIDFKNRREVAKPFREVSKEEWEQIVGKMMKVKIAANGVMSEAEQFTAASDAEDDKDWVAWNQERDTDVK